MVRRNNLFICCYYNRYKLDLLKPYGCARGKLTGTRIANGIETAIGFRVHAFVFV